MRKLLPLLFLILFLGGSAAAQTTTTFNGLVKDLTNTPVPTGQVSFILKPSLDTTISGNARFTSSTVFCEIHNPAVVSTTGTGTITVVVGTAQNWQVGDSFLFFGTGDATLNGNTVATAYVITAVNSTTSFNFTQSGTHTNGAGGTVGGLYKSGGTGPCAVTQNSALTPGGTSYSVGLWPLFSLTSTFNTYAIGAGPIDISTVVPTPGQQPAYSFVDVFTNQSISGNKTFTGTTFFSGNGTHSGVETFSLPSNQLLFGAFPNQTTLNFPAPSGNVTLNMPNTADTLVGRATTDTLTNKTFASPLVTGTSPQMTFQGTGAGIVFNNTGVPASKYQIDTFTTSGQQTLDVTYQTGAPKNIFKLDGTGPAVFLPSAGEVLEFAEGSSAGAGIGSGTDPCYGDSTTHTLKCSYNGGPFLNMPQVIASGTAAMTTAAIAAGACGATVTVGATGVLTTDSISFSFNAAPGANPASVPISSWPTANNVNFQYCVPAGAAGVTPSAATLNWRVVR